MEISAKCNQKKINKARWKSVFFGLLVCAQCFVSSSSSFFLLLLSLCFDCVDKSIPFEPIRALGGNKVDFLKWSVTGGGRLCVCVGDGWLSVDYRGLLQSSYFNHNLD